MAADVPGGPVTPEHGARGEPAGPVDHGSQAAPENGSQAAPENGSQAAPENGSQAAPENGSAPSGQPGGIPGAARRPRTGRNLPLAIAVGAGMGALAIVTLFTVKATFLVYVGAAVGVALWELSRALGTRGIGLPLVPVAAGAAAAITLAYWEGERALTAALGLTVIAILTWRMRGGTMGYLKDVTAGVFALAYIPLMASFVALMLAAPDGARRTLVFLIVTVCSDIGGYFAGILTGRHPMAPVISPKKTWEGLGGSVFACVLGGAIALPLLLHAAAWQGVLVGAAAVTAATLGDLAASMVKRDLVIKDWGTILPGHGGILDRIDSLLITAPVVWLLLTVFLAR